MLQENSQEFNEYLRKGALHVNTTSIVISGVNSQLTEKRVTAFRNRPATGVNNGLMLSLQRTQELLL